MMSSRVYYMGLNDDMTNMNGEQFHVGEEYGVEPDEVEAWFPVYRRVVYAILDGARVVEVEPLTPVRALGAPVTRYVSRIHVLRELSREQIMKKLAEENASAREMILLKPTYEELTKQRIHHRDYYDICFKYDWLSTNQKKALLPRSWHVIIDDADKLSERGLRNKKED